MVDSGPMDFAAVDSIKNVIFHGTELMMETLAGLLVLSSLVKINQIKYSPLVKPVKIISSVRLKSTIHVSALLIIMFKTP